MDISVIDPLAGPDWDQLVDLHPDVTFFHRSPWARVLASTYGHRPTYLKIQDVGEMVALLPLMGVKSWLTGNRGVTLPFTDHCAPLLFQRSKAIVAALVDFAKGNGWRRLEVRDGIAGMPASVEYAGHRLDLRAGTTALLAGVHSSIRQGIRKAEASEVSVSADTSESGMRDFYELHVQTRRHHGVPPQPYRFFENIVREVFQIGAGFVMVARQSARPVAAAVFFQHGGSAIYKFGASDRRLQRSRATTLVMWRAIEKLVAQGSRCLEFGRTSLGNAGLLRYKRQWGGAEFRIPYVRIDTATGQALPAVDRAAGWHNRCFSALPTPMNRLAGAFLYPHMD